METLGTSENVAAARRNIYVFGAASFFNDTASEMPIGSCRPSLFLLAQAPRPWG